jgi:hypothetical protein
MHANVIALPALLLGAGLLAASSAQAVVTPGSYVSVVDPAQPANQQPAAAVIRLADGGKLGDKYMAGKAGGAKGIGSQKGKKDGKK